MFICIYRDVLAAIDDYVGERPGKKGVLLGSWAAAEGAGGEQAVLIKSFIGDRPHAGEAEVKIGGRLIGKEAGFFTQEDFAYFEQIRSETFPGLRMVGWVRGAPPGKPLKEDAKIQQKFFNLPWQIFYLADRNKVAVAEECYFWEQGDFRGQALKVLESDGFAQEIIDEDLIENPEYAKKRKIFLALAAAILLAAVAVGGMFYSDSMKENEKKYNAQINSLQNQLSSLQQEPPNQSGGPQMQAKDADIKYIIRSGDTLEGISLSFYGTPAKAAAIAEYNKITDPNAIDPGQVIYIKR